MRSPEDVITFLRSLAELKEALEDKDHPDHALMKIIHQIGSTADHAIDHHKQLVEEFTCLRDLCGLLVAKIVEFKDRKCAFCGEQFRPAPADKEPEKVQ